MTYRVQIEYGVPIPAPLRGGASRSPKYPFAELAIGASFWAPVSATALRACARRAKLPHRVFTVREETRDSLRGARCWRKA